VRPRELLASDYTEERIAAPFSLRPDFGRLTAQLPGVSASNSAKLPTHASPDLVSEAESLRFPPGTWEVHSRRIQHFHRCQCIDGSRDDDSSEVDVFVWAVRYRKQSRAIG
jgi:hypothetical protein